MDAAHFRITHKSLHLTGLLVYNQMRCLATSRVCDCLGALTKFPVASNISAILD